MAKGLPKSIAKKYGISKRAWAVYRGRKKKRSAAKPRKRSRASSGGRKTARRRSNRRRRSSRRSSKYGVIGTVLKLAIGAYIGNIAGGQIQKYADPQGNNLLFRAGGSLVGAVLAKKFLGKLNPTVGTGAASVLALGAAISFMDYMKTRKIGM